MKSITSMTINELRQAEWPDLEFEISERLRGSDQRAWNLMTNSGRQDLVDEAFEVVSDGDEFMEFLKERL